MRRTRQVVERNRLYGMPGDSVDNFKLELSEEGHNRIVVLDFHNVVQGIWEMAGTDKQFCDYLDKAHGIFVKIQEA